MNQPDQDQQQYAEDAYQMKQVYDLGYFELDREKKSMTSKYNVGDKVTHTLFGIRETGVITGVEPMDNLTDPYIYKVGGGSWWIAESDLTLVQPKLPVATGKLSISDAMERGMQYTDGQHFGDYINLRTDESHTKGFACALGTAACGLKEKSPRELVLETSGNWKSGGIQEILQILQEEWPELFEQYDQDGFSELGRAIYYANDDQHKTIPEIIADLKKEGK